MTYPTSMIMHATSRLGTALLLAATATGSAGRAQRLPSRAASVIASVSTSAHPVHGLVAAVKPPSQTHASVAVTKRPGTTTHGLPDPFPRGHAIATSKAVAIAHIHAVAVTHPEPVIALSSAPKLSGSSPVFASRRSTPEQPLAGPAASPPASFSFTGTTDAEHVLHLTVGHLLFLNTQERVRRIYIANPAVLDSYTVSPNQIVITAKTPGLSSVVVWDQTDQKQVYMVSSDVSVDELRSSMKQAMPADNIQVEGREAKVVLTGTVATDAVSDAAGKLAALFSKDVANSLVVNSAKVRQVRLKVRIVEVDRSKLDQFGINIFNPGGSTVGGGTTSQFPVTTVLTPASGSTPATLSVSDPLNFLFYSFKYNLGFTIKDLENKQILQILAEPTITTLSGQKASFLAGGEFPFPVVQGSAGGTATVTVQFRPYGVKLEFTPQVNVDGSIGLKVAPEVSALDFTNAVTISGYTIPALSTKRADTQVVLQSGQSFAISGLLDRRATNAFSHTPGISSVPILGQLFRSKGINLSTSELIVIVTPTIVDPLSEVLDPAEPVTEQHNRKDNPAAPRIDPVLPTPGQPVPIVPYLQPDNFDNTLPGSGKKKP